MKRFSQNRFESDQKFPLRSFTCSSDSNVYYVELKPISSIDVRSLRLARALFDHMIDSAAAPRFVISFAEPARVGAGVLHLLEYVNRRAIAKGGNVQVKVDDENVWTTLKLIHFNEIVPVSIGR